MDTKRQAFLKRFSEGSVNKDDFSLLEAVGEYYEKNAKEASHCFSRYELAKSRLVFYKHKVVSSLTDYLTDFETGMAISGTKVIYVKDAEEAVNEISKLIEKDRNIFINSDRLIKEIALASFLSKKNIQFHDSRFSDFPYQVLPYPASSFWQMIAKKLNIDDIQNQPNQLLSLYKSQLLESAFKDAIYVSGADFIVSDPAAVVILENEGIGNLLSAFCKKHVIVAGIDQMIASISELDYFTSLYAAHVQGNLSVWNQTLFFGPKKANEADGPDEMYVILIDNGRTRLLKEEFQRSVFHCIHCGACTALCPVFKHVNSSHGQLSGPLDCVISPIRDGFENSGFMAFACTLCGKCSEICPSRINFQEIILYNRKEAVEKNAFSVFTRQHIKLLKRMMLKQKVLDSPYHRFILKVAFKNRFGKQKEFPDFKKKSFHIIWKGS